MADPNTYQGPGEGGTHKAYVNVVPEGGGVDNTGGSDAMPNLVTALALILGAGQASWMPKGAYSIRSSPSTASNPTVQSGTTLRGSPNATIVSTMAPIGPGFPQACIFYAQPTFNGNTGTIANPATTLNGGINAAVVALTLAAAAGFPSGGQIAIQIDNEIMLGTFNGTVNVTGLVRGAFGTVAAAHLNGAAITYVIPPGSSVILATLTTAPAAGQYIQLLHAESCEDFRIASVTGAANPYLLALESERVEGTDYTSMPWVTGDTINVMTSVPLSIDLDGQGALITGTGDEGILLSGARGSIIARWRIDGTSGGFSVAAMGFDVGGKDNIIEKCTVDLTSAGSLCPGKYLQSNVGSIIRDGQVSNAAYSGSILLDCVGCVIENEWSYGCGYGHTVTAFSGATFGSFDCIVSGGGSVGHVTTGLYVGAGKATRTIVTNYTAKGGQIGASGITVGANAITSTIKGCDTPENAVGVLVMAGSTGTKIIGHNADNCGGPATGNGACLKALAEVDVDGFTANLGAGNATTAVILAAAGAVFSIRGMHINSAVPAGNGIQISAGSGELDGCVVNMTGGTTPIAFEVVGGVTNCNKCVAEGAGIEGFVVSGGVLNVAYCTCASAGGFGAVVTGGTLSIGPGCDFGGSAAPVSNFGGTVTMCQTGGVAAVIATVALTFAQHYNTAIELAAGAAGDSTITTYKIPGMTWVARNLSVHNLTLKTSTAATVTVAAGKSAIVQIDAAGDMARVTADT